MDNILDCDDSDSAANPGNDMSLTSYGAYSSPSISAKKRQWKYSDTPGGVGGVYANNIDEATKAEYIPQFDTPGEYYIVCESQYEISEDNFITLTSNEVLIDVNSDGHQPAPFINKLPETSSLFSNSIFPRRSQSLSPGEPGATLKVTRSPVVRFLFHAERTATETPITNLTIDDFIATENGTEITCKEHFKSVKKGGINYYQNIVLFLDVSNSISSSDLLEMKNAAQVLIDSMGPGDLMKLTAFDDTLNEMTGTYDPENPYLYHDFESKTQINEAQHINRITIGQPSTDLYASIIAAAKRCNDFYCFSSVSQTFLIMITDGFDTAKTKKLADALSGVDGKRVFTVGIGSDADIDVLNQLGTFDSFHIDNFSQLTGKLQDIKQAMVAYGENLHFLEYASPIRTGAVTLAISPSRNCETEEITSGFSADNFHSVSDEELYWVSDKQEYCSK